MRFSLFPSDESLPTWLHTTLLILIGAPVAAYLGWHGTVALFTGRLEPISGPEFGQYFFGNVVLYGRPAKLAGASLILDAMAFMALLLRFSRFDVARATTGVAIVLFALSMAFSFAVNK